MKKAIYFSLLIALATGCMNDELKMQVVTGKIKVRVDSVIAATSAQELSYSGTVEASQTIPLNFQTTGIVKDVFVEAGDEVSKNQVLATLDDTDMQNLYATMLAKFNQAQDAYDRLKHVHDEGSLPEIKWVEMKTNLDQAKASLDLARNNLDKCKLTAPVIGTVGRRNIEPGQTAFSLVSAPIELVRIEKVAVKIAVPENEINKIKKGEKATISVLAVDGTRFQGVVTNISPVAELMSRTYTVKISVDNPARTLKPGMVCDVRMELGQRTATLIVPYQSVRKDSESNNYVFVVNPGHTSVKKQVVIIGKYNGTGIEITGGLTEGQLVVTGGIDKLSDNSLIEM